MNQERPRGASATATVPFAVLACPDLDDFALRIYGVLAAFAQRTGVASPSVPTLTEIVGRRERSVRYALKRLLAVGAIEVERESAGGSGPKATVAYRVMPCTAVHPMPCTTVHPYPASSPQGAPPCRVHRRAGEHIGRASPTDGSGLPAPPALRASGRSPAAAVSARASSPPEPSEHDSGVSLVLGTHTLGVTAAGAGAEPAIDASPSKLRSGRGAHSRPPSPQPSRPARAQADVFSGSLRESATPQTRSSDVPGSDGAARERAQAADDAPARDDDRPRVADHLHGLDDAPRRSGSTGPAPRRAGEIARVRPAPASARSRVTAGVTAHASRRSR